MAGNTVILAYSTVVTYVLMRWRPYTTHVVEWSIDTI